MITLEINYGTLDKVLKHFDFEKRALDDSHIAYLHRESDTLLVYPMASSDEKVLPSHLMTARRMLVEKVGIDEAELRRVVLSIFYRTEWIQTKNGE